MKNFLLIDGGWLKYSVKFRMRKAIGQDDDVALVKHEFFHDIMHDVIATTLTSIIKRYETVFAVSFDKIELCDDYGISWRHSRSRVKVPGQDEVQLAYKSGRYDMSPEQIEAREQYTKAYLHKLDEVCEYAKFGLLRDYSAEADDLLTVRGRKLADQGNFVVILSHDEDLSQSVYTNGNGQVVVAAQGRGLDIKKVSVTESFKQIIDNYVPSIFGDVLPYSGLTIDFLKKDSIAVAPWFVILSKITYGDGSDAIPPLMLRMSVGKSGKPRFYRLNAKQWNLVLETMLDFRTNVQKLELNIDMLYDSEWINKFVDLCHTLMFGTSIDDITLEWRDFYIERFRENRFFVSLNRAEMAIWNRVFDGVCDNPKYSEGYSIKQIPTNEILEKFSREVSSLKEGLQVLSEIKAHVKQTIIVE